MDGLLLDEVTDYLNSNCDNDDMSGIGQGVIAIVEAWNRRASPAVSADAMLVCIPGNWIDPLLTGPAAVIHVSPCPEIEALLNGVRERLRAALAGKEP